MDPLEWAVTLGNVNVAVYLNQTLGWIYWLVKLIIYGVIVGLIARKLYRAWKYNYLVPISVVGPEKTINEFTDRGSIFMTKEGTVEFRCLKTGKMPFVPDRKHITPLTSRWWWQPTGVIRLYQYGSSNYSITPIAITLADRIRAVASGKAKKQNDRKEEEYNKNCRPVDSDIQMLDLKFTPVEPELGAIAQDIKEGMSIVDSQSWVKQYAPIIGGLIPFLIFGILLFFVAGQFADAASAISNGVHAMERQCAIGAPAEVQQSVTAPATEGNGQVEVTQGVMDKIASGELPW